MLNANEYEIRKLLFDSEVSRYKISKETGIPQNTLSDLVNGKTDIKKMRFDNAAKLTEYAKKLKGASEMGNYFVIRELGSLFETTEAAVDFAQSYWDELKEDRRTSEMDTYGWESVADDIIETIGQGVYEEGDFVNIEIGSYWTKSGNPELIHVGELASVPELNEDGDFKGEYILK